MGCMLSRLCLQRAAELLSWAGGGWHASSNLLDRPDGGRLEHLRIRSLLLGLHRRGNRLGTCRALLCLLLLELLLACGGAHARLGVTSRLVDGPQTIRRQSLSKLVHCMLDVAKLFHICLALLVRDVGVCNLAFELLDLHGKCLEHSHRILLCHLVHHSRVCCSHASTGRRWRRGVAAGAWSGSLLLRLALRGIHAHLVALHCSGGVALRRRPDTLRTYRLPRVLRLPNVRSILPVVRTRP